MLVWRVENEVMLSEGECNYKKFFSINLMYVLSIIFSNADLKILLMDYIVLSKLSWCFTQQAGSKIPIAQIC